MPYSSAIVMSLVLSISEWVDLGSGACLLKTGTVLGFVVELYSVVEPRCLMGVLSFSVWLLYSEELVDTLSFICI